MVVLSSSATINSDDLYLFPAAVQITPSVGADPGVEGVSNIGNAGNMNFLTTQRAFGHYDYFWGITPVSAAEGDVGAKRLAYDGTVAHYALNRTTANSYGTIPSASAVYGVSSTSFVAVAPQFSGFGLPTVNTGSISHFNAATLTETNAAFGIDVVNAAGGELFYTFDSSPRPGLHGTGVTFLALRGSTSLEPLHPFVI